MFQQIVSNLSVTPQAASQLTFYARRLKQESITRFFSAFAAVLLVLLQVVTVVSPASASNAASDNDLIPGGYTTKADFLSIYDKSPGLRTIYTHFGVSRADIASSATVMTKINSRDAGNTLKSVGHHPAVGCDPDTKIVVGPGAEGTVYLRNLSCFDTGSNKVNGSTYDALVGKRSSDGGYFAILKVCGNIVVKSVPAPPTAACSSLTSTPVSGQAPLAVKLTAAAATSGGASIKSYIFDYGDGSAKETVTTPNLKWGPVLHTYTAAKAYTATVSITSTVNSAATSSAACAVKITPTAPVVTTECKPGVPIGSPLCTSPALACVSLTGTPASGTPPLQVTFVATGIEIIGMCLIGWCSWGGDG